MDCCIDSCPHRNRGDKDCPIEIPADTLQRPVNRDQSLVVSSLELGRVLADHGKVMFRAQGTCMFPCIRHGDVLTIESRTIEQVQDGDIVVFRRNGMFFGHRAIAKGSHDGKSYVLTRPDRSSEGSDGPSYVENVLGVVTSIQRDHELVSLSPQQLDGPTALQAAAWEWWNYRAFPILAKVIRKVQYFRVYKRIATMWLDCTQKKRRYTVRVPLSARQSHDLYREFPSEQFVPDQLLWRGGPALRWILDLYFMREKTAAGSAIVAWHPDECPRGSGWIIEEYQIRSKYRSAGLEDALFQRAKEILAPGGMMLQRRPK